LLFDRGETVVAVACRHPEHAAAAAEFIGGDIKAVTYEEIPAHVDRVIIAVPDGAIGAVSALLAEGGLHSGAALHTCGALGPEALFAGGFSRGTLHPLQTIATPEQGLAALPGSAFAIAGDEPALSWAAEIVAILKGNALRIATGKQAVYHAAAVMASNYIVSLIDAAGALMKAAGIEEKQAIAALAPLIRASVENSLTLGPQRALTGPIERGDCATVARHVRAMDGLPPSVRELYRAAGLQALQISRRKAPSGKFEELEALLRGE
jgi:predicted short-subunit dehydrogenase-like oxidoreductase (DUF2520 family)